MAISRARHGVRLDEFDIRILVALQRDGRITKLKLAENIGLSPSPCWERMRRLERSGLIRGYHADVDLPRIVKTESFFVELTLRSHQASDFQRFESAIQDVPEIIECYAVGGGVDYVLQVVCTSIEQYQRLMESLLGAEIGILRYFTYAVTKAIKRQREYPIRRLLSMEKTDSEIT